MNTLKSICVFCGSSRGARPEYAAAARALGAELVARGQRLIYGGAQIGLMGVVADAVRELGGETVGVLPRSLAGREVAHPGLSELVIVDSMHERKARMAELADGFVALPGGLGTLDELFEILTWAQLGLHRKPCGLLDTCEFFAPLRALLARAVEERFLRPEHRDLLLVSSDASRLLDDLAGFEHPALEESLDGDTS